METLLRDLRYAARQMARAPLFTVIIVVVVACGIGVNAVVLSFVRALMTIPAPGVAPSDRLVSAVVLDTRSKNRPPRVSLSYANFIRMRSEVSQFSALAGWANTKYPVDLGNGTRSISVAQVSGDYFAVFNINSSLGSLPRFEDMRENEPFVVISNTLWQSQYGGATDVIGKSIRINGALFRIVGVTPRLFTGIGPFPPALWISRQAQLFMPRDSGVAPAISESFPMDGIVGRLKSGASMASARSALIIAATPLLADASTPPNTISAVVARTRMLEAPDLGYEKDIFAGVGMLGAATLLILLIACTNVAALILGRAMSRRHEIAIRFSLGASRLRIVRQLVTESTVLAVIGALCGALVLFWMRDLVFHATADIFPIYLPLDPVTVGIIFLVTLLTGFFFGLAPALHVTRTTIAESLKHGGGGSDRRRRRLQERLLIGQLALSLPLLLLTALVIGTVTAERASDSALVAPENVIAFKLEYPARRLSISSAINTFDALQRRLLDIPGIDRMSVADHVPTVFSNISSRGFVTLRAEPPMGLASPGKFFPHMEPLEARPGFFETLGLPIVRGRAFDAADTLARNTAIVSETDARALWPNQDPLGKRLIYDDARFSPLTVVGVVKDMHGLVPSSVPLVYLSARSSLRFGGIVLVRTRGPAATFIPRIQHEIRQLDPDLAIDAIATVEQAQQANTRWAARIAGGASALVAFALALAAVGLAGIVLFSVNQRTREVGVRMALGARANQIVVLFLKEGASTAIIAFVIGIPLAIAISVVAHRMVRLSLAVNMASSVIALITLLAVVLVASWVPARRAVRVDPVTALRAE